MQRNTKKKINKRLKKKQRYGNWLRKKVKDSDRAHE